MHAVAYLLAAAGASAARRYATAAGVSVDEVLDAMADAFPASDTAA